MRIAFISDIHGNAVALEEVLTDIKKQHVDKIVVLGDIAFRGPEPQKSLQLIRELNTDVIKGNADEWIVRGIQDGEVPAGAINLMKQERDWGYSKLSAEEIDYLKNLPLDYSLKVNEHVTIHAFHATPTNLFDVVAPTASDEDIQQKLIRNEHANIYVYGHIHKAYIRYLNGKVIMNIGSVGLPFDGFSKASYGIIEITGATIQTEIHRVQYDTEKVARQYQENQYPNIHMMSDIIRTGRI